MESLLSAWKRASWLQAEQSTHRPAPAETVLTPDEWIRWAEILRTAIPVPPRTHIEGLRSHAAFANLDAKQLEELGVVKIIEQRVATRWLSKSRPEAAQLGGYTWSLAWRPAASDVDVETAAHVLGKRFREISLHDNVLLARESRWRTADDIAVLLANTTTEENGERLLRLWGLARALDIEESFLRQMSAVPRRAVTEAFVDILTSAGQNLNIQTDWVLEAFAEGYDAPADKAPSSRGLPESRFAALLEARAFAKHLPRQIGHDYFEDVARSYVIAADAYAAGNMLKRLPPGCAILAAFDAICKERPEFIATFVWHPAYHAEGAFALLQLPHAQNLPIHETLDLSDEWNEVQRLGREQLVLADRSEDRRSVVALGIHDEQQAILQRYPAPVRPREPALEEDDRVSPWQKVLAAPERAAEFMDILGTYFLERTKHGDSALVFGMRLVSLARDHRELRDESTRLARSLVSAYVGSLALDPETLSPSDALSAYGSLLDDLRRALVAGDAADAWNQWLRPFDVEEYIELAQAQASRPEAMQIEPGVVNPMFDVPHVVLAHAEAIVAQASAANDASVEALEAVMNLYFADRRTELHVKAFDWYQLAHTVLPKRRPIGYEPLFTRIGHLLRRSLRGSALLQRVLDENPELHIVAYTFVGVRGDGARAERVREKLHQLVNEALTDRSGIAIGQALELAGVLHTGGLGRDAERLARRVVQVAESPEFSRLIRRDYMDRGFALLAGALAQQGLWSELLDLNPDVRGLSEQLFLSNMRALAFMEKGDMRAAKRLLDDVLGRSPADQVALVNTTAYYVRQRDWAMVIKAAQDARSMLPAERLDGVLENEAIARECLGDKFTADELRHSLRAATMARSYALTPEARQDAVLDENVAKIRVPFDDGGASADIAIITALPEEYEAVRARLTNPVLAPHHEQYPNIFGWILGSIARADESGSYRVVLAMCGQSGNLRSQHVTTRTIDRWRPRYILFSGIAGGFEKDGLRQGDIVVSRTVWFYGYGKIADGSIQLRHRDTFPADAGLLTQAIAFNSETNAWCACEVQVPNPGRAPKMLAGMVGSGDWVIDDLKPEVVRAILRACPDELRAVEMEAAGMCVAIEMARSEGRNVGFMVVRGISDMPKNHMMSLVRMARALGGRLRGRAVEEMTQTKERDLWKEYASAIAANFIVMWIASRWWPVPPRAQP